MSNPAKQNEDRVDMIVQLLKTVIQADLARPATLVAAERAFASLCDEVGEDTAWSLLLDVPRTSWLDLVATHAAAA